MTLEAGTQIGKYAIRRKLAEGGMAEIYLCTARGPEGFEKEVVIKRVRSFLASDPDFVGMFIAEARLASRLNHANVVQIFDFDKHEDTYYLAMEYVRGCSLWELRKQCKELMVPVPPVLVAHIGAEVARGLHYAHRLKVNGQPLDLVHRDVTPHNVLLSYDGAVKLTDFGIAKAGNKLTQPGVLKGKFAYMSPEQARGEPVDARTDIFALGVVLWEMLTGGRLFDGDSEIAVLRAVQQSAIPPPARLNPEVPADLDATVVRALERDPAARFQTAGELERALAQCVLTHATSVDDTDLPAFLRRLFPTSITLHSLPVVQVQERTHVVEDASVPGGGDAAAPRAAAPREPTAVMAGVSRSRGGAAVEPKPSPDDDVSAATFVLPRQGEPAAVPPAPTPMMPLPALSASAAASSGAASKPSESVPVHLPSEAGQGSARPPGSPPTVSMRRPAEGSVGGAALPGTPAAQEGDAEAGSAARRESSVHPEGSAFRQEQSPVAPRGEAESSAQRDASARKDAPERGDGAEVSAVREPRSPAGMTGAVSEARAAAALEPRAGGGSTARRRPLALGLSLALGLAVVGGGVALMRARPEPAPTEPVATAAPVPTEAPRQEAPPPPASGGTVASPEPESEVDGLKREQVLGTAPAPVEAAPQPPVAKDSARAVSTGTLVVRATPYATVYINGKRRDDVVGRASYKLPPGTYRLLFQHPAGEKRLDVTIAAGATVTHEFRAPRSR